MKKIISVFMALVMLTAVIYIAPVSEAANVSFNEIVSSAATIIRQNEGWYNSVVCDDNGALSVGWVQWHGNRALNLLKSIVNANPSNALKLLGNALYNEILNSKDWSTRILTESEKPKVQALIDTTEGHNEQDKLASNDISGYITYGMKLGITSPAVLVYFADIVNQCGSGEYSGGGATRVATAAKNAVGSFSAITLEALHNAALADVAAGKKPFIPRRNNTFTNCVLLGWDGIADPYEVWAATTGLNIRSGPGTQYPIISSLSNGSKTIIFDKTMVGDSMWGETNNGWLSLEYCSYVSGNLPTPVCFDYTQPDETIKIDGINTVRNTGMTVVYDSSYAAYTSTNAYGAEAIVGADGMVISDPKIGVGNSKIPAGGFVISGHNDATNNGGKEICSKLKAGYYVYFNKAAMTVEIFRNKDFYLEAAKKIPRVTLSVDDVNCARGDSQLVVYTSSFKSARTGTNKYGSEAVVSNGKVLYTPVSGACNYEIPANGFVISGHDGSSAKKGYEIRSNMKAGDYAYFDKGTMTVRIYGNKDSYLLADKRITSGSTVGDLPEIKKTGAAFLGWYTTPSGGEKVTSQTVYSSRTALKLYPHWGAEAPITFDANGGTLDGVTEKKITSVNSSRDENTIVLYDNAYKNSYTETNIYGSDVRVSADGEVLDNVVYGACNLKIPEGGFVISGHNNGYFWMESNIKAGNYITFNADTKVITVYRDRATFEAAYKQLSANSALGALPAASRAGCYQLTGWAKADGELVTADTVAPLGGLTLTAQWAQHASTTEDVVLPTCTENGRKTIVCNTCGVTVSDEIIPATGHDWIVVNSVDATCTTEGYTDYVCSNDPEHTKRDDIIPPTGVHTPGEAVIEAEATCTEDGLGVVYCTVCNEIISEEIIPATDHEWIVVNSVDATCTTEGYTDYVCSNDPEHTKRDIIPPTGVHTPGEAVIEAEATCTEDGLKIVRCTICDEIISEEIIPATDHDWIVVNSVDATCTTEGYTDYVCSNDPEHTKRDDIIPPTGVHTPGEAVIEAEATCTEDGLKIVRCTVCDEIISEEIIPALGHKWVEKEKASPTDEADGYILYVCENDEEHTMKFSYTSENVVFGDVNNDGYVDSDDAIYLLCHLTDYESYPVNAEVQKGCDFNGDGYVDSDDAIYLLYHTLLPNLFKLTTEED